MLKLNLGSGAHPLPGFTNLDRPEWDWSRPLPVENGSVDGITVSHSLMYAPADLWPWIFMEFARALKVGGIVRITEDATDDPRSERFGGYVGRASLTTFAKVQEHLLFAKLMPHECGPGHSWFGDPSLIQNWHGVPPKVFHIEGRKP